MPTRSIVERLFLQGRLSRRQMLAGLAACGLSAAAIELLTGSDVLPMEAEPQVADYLCLIVLDGFRPEYAALAPMPALDSLKPGGTVYDRAWVGQIQSMTPVSHATLSTGALPRHHGVIGFEWRDAVTGREVLDAWEQGPALGYVGHEIHRAHPACIPRAIKGANPAAKVVAVSSEKVYAADAMGARAADYVLYHHLANHRLVARGLPGQAPPQQFLSRPTLHRALPLQHFSDWDELSTELALAALEEFRPHGLMVNLPGADIYGHAYGALATPRVMSRVVAGLDRSIGRIITAYQHAGMFDSTLFVVTADHGMVSNHHSVDGALVQAAVKRGGARLLFHTGGTARYIYLEDESRPRAPAVAAEMARIPNVAAAYFRTSSGAYELVGKDLRPALNAAFRRLLSTFSGPSAPDVVAPYRENTIGTKLARAYGNHGGLSWGVQAVPLVLAGPGVRSAVRSSAAGRLIDVAPTILRALGLTGHHLDGIPLADALTDPTADEVHAQDTLDRALRHDRDALIEQSEKDVWEDQRSSVLPPPSPPPMPWQPSNGL